MFREDRYRIEVEGRVETGDAWLRDWNLGTENGRTILSGPLNGKLADAEMYGMLERLRERGLKLLSVNRIQPDLEEVFVRLVGEA